MELKWASFGPGASNQDPNQRPESGRVDASARWYCNADLDRTRGEPNPGEHNCDPNQHADWESGERNRDRDFNKRPEHESGQPNGDLDFNKRAEPEPGEPNGNLDFNKRAEPEPGKPNRDPDPGEHPSHNQPERRSCR